MFGDPYTYLLWGGGLAPPVWIRKQEDVRLSLKRPCCCCCIQHESSSSSIMYPRVLRWCLCCKGNEPTSASILLVETISVIHSEPAYVTHVCHGGKKMLLLFYPSTRVHVFFRGSKWRRWFRMNEFILCASSKPHKSYSTYPSPPTGTFPSPLLYLFAPFT